MKLEELLESLDAAASEHTKQAEADDKPQVSKELDALLTKEATRENASQALEAGSKFASEILEKLAQAAVTEAAEKVEQKEEVKAEAAPTTTEVKEVEKVAEEKAPEAKTEEVEKKAEEATPETKEEDMNKQAQDAGKSLAEQIIEKLAAEANNAPGGPGLIRADHAKSVAQDDAKIGPTPGRNGTISQLFDAIVAKAKAVSNPAHEDQMVGGPQAPHEAQDAAMGTRAIPPSPDVTEKQAAVQALCDAGLEWEVAVDLVKSAAEEIAQEEVSQVKMAAVSHLVGEGMNFDTAVDAVNKSIEELSKEQE